jgi:sugar lactone lactonase YvrE
MKRVVGVLLVLAVVAAGVWIFWPSEPPRPRGPLARVVTLAGAGARAVPAPLGDPFGVAADEEGTIFVADGIAGQIFRLAKDAPPAVVASGLDMPSAVAVAPDGALVVANTGAHTVVRVDPETGAVEVVAGAAGASGLVDGTRGDARFFGPVGVAVAADGTVFVADTYNDRLRAIAPDGTVRTLGGPFDTPCGVAVAPDGALFVADTGSGQILRVAPDGATSAFVGPDGGLDEPTALAFLDPATLVVADSGGSRLAAVDLGGPVVAVRSLFDQQLVFPTGVARTPEGDLVVADGGAGLVRAVVPEESDRVDVAAPPPIDADEIRSAVASRWPFDPPERLRELAATFGEIRGERVEEKDVWLHNGLDVPGRYGETVHAMYAERVTRPIAVEGTGGPRERLRLPLFGYIHMRVGRDQDDRPFESTPFLFDRDEKGRVTRARVPRGARIAAGDPVGSLNNQNHVHLLAGQPGREVNLLTALDLPGLVDTVAPVVERVEVVDGRVLVEAYDRHDGNAPSRKLGVYRVEVALVDAEGRATPAGALVFDRMPDDPHAGKTIYAEGSNSGYTGRTRFVYAASGPAPLDLSGAASVRVTVSDVFGNRTTVERAVGGSRPFPGRAAWRVHAPARRASSPPPRRRGGSGRQIQPGFTGLLSCGFSRLRSEPLAEAASREAQ